MSSENFWREKFKNIEEPPLFFGIEGADEFMIFFSLPSQKHFLKIGSLTTYSHLSNEPGVHAYRFWKIPQKKIPPPRLMISLLKCLILLQNLMKIFLTVILSYKTLF